MKCYKELFDKICLEIKEFETGYDENSNISDGEWLDVFYSLLLEVRTSVIMQAKDKINKYCKDYNILIKEEN